MNEKVSIGGKQYIIKFLSILVIILLAGVILAGCDMLDFVGEDDEEEVRDKLPEWAVRNLVEAYYDSIEVPQPEKMEETLHPERDIDVVWNGEFYEDTVDLSYSVSRDNYIEGYEDYFRIDVEEIIIEDGVISNGDGEATFEAYVSKEIEDGDDFSYDLIMEMEKHDSSWYIYSIDKQN